MWPLLACSVLGLAVMLDRLLICLWWWQSFPRLVRRLEPLVRAGKWHAAEQACRRGGLLSRFAALYLQHRDEPAATREDILRREATLLLDKLEERVKWLAVIGQLSPMLGLLGTVTGLVEAFHRVEVLGGQVKPSDLASGIWEALITTVFGLVIALPTLSAYYLCEARVDTVAKQCTVLTSYLDEWCRDAVRNNALTVIPREVDGQGQPRPLMGSS